MEASHSQGKFVSSQSCSSDSATWVLHAMLPWEGQQVASSDEGPWLVCGLLSIYPLCKLTLLFRTVLKMWISFQMRLYLLRPHQLWKPLNPWREALKRLTFVSQSLTLVLHRSAFSAAPQVLSSWRCPADTNGISFPLVKASVEKSVTTCDVPRPCTMVSVALG
jgi:hypothetical protein